MKKIICQLTIVCMALSACNKNNNEKLYESFGVVKENAGKFYIRTDKSNFISLNDMKLTDKDKDARVWLMFSTKDPNADTVKADVYRFLKISNVVLKTSGLDSLKNDPIKRMNEGWFAQDYLTLSLDVSSYSAEMLDGHKYFLYTNPPTAVSDTVVSDTLHLELRHDNNRDNGDHRYTKLLAIESAKIFDTAKITPSVVAIKYLRGNNNSDNLYVKVNTEK